MRRIGVIGAGSLVRRGGTRGDACNPSAAEYEALVRETRAKSVGELSATFLPGPRLVRVFSAVDASAIAASARRTTAKLGVPLAGDDPGAVQIAARLVRDVGCEPIAVGDLTAATRLQRGSPAFRANTDATELRRLLGASDQ
jgi:8-hydroxy-5-deazaflavin:NADPH oxidoreductase